MEPMTVAVRGIAAGELARRPWGAEGAAQLGRVLVAGLGLALPLVGYALLFWSHGALAALVHDTIAGLPQRIRWFVPFLPLGRRALLVGALPVSTFLALAAWKRWETAPGRATRALVMAVGFGIASVVLARALGPLVALGAYLRAGGLVGEVVGPLPWLVVVLVGGAAACAVASRPATAAEAAPALFVFFAVGAILQLYPAADWPHALASLPAVLPVLAWPVGWLTATEHGRRPS